MSFAPDAPSYEAKEAKDSWYQPLRENWAAVATHPTTYWVELVIAAFDDWVPDPVGEPAIGVGYSFDLRDGSWPPGLGLDGHGVGALAAHGITVSEGPEDWIGRCFKTLYLGEVPSHGLSLADQAEWVAQWVCDALASIEAQKLD
jgi:hypothetical protein